MKRLNHLLLVSLVCQLFILSSCDKDEDKDKDADSIIGTWTLISSTLSECDDPDNEGLETFSCTNTDCQKVTFMADGTYEDDLVESGVIQVTTGTYTLIGNQITLCEDVDDCDDYGYTVSRGTLTLTTRDAGCDQVIILEK
jgi:hypothetical protein